MIPMRRSRLVCASARLNTGYKLRTRKRQDHANPTDTETHCITAIIVDNEKICIIATNNDYHYLPNTKAGEMEAGRGTTGIQTIIPPYPYRQRISRRLGSQPYHFIAPQRIVGITPEYPYMSPAAAVNRVKS